MLTYLYLNVQLYFVAQKKNAFLFGNSVTLNRKLWRQSVKLIHRENHQKYKAINDVNCFWYKKCEASSIYVTV